MDIAVVVNLRSRSGSETVARTCRRRLPGAQVLASRSLDDSVRFAESLATSPPRLLASAGGDGTAVALINAVQHLSRDVATGDSSSVNSPNTLLGVLPLGTGNGWAHTTGAPGWRRAIEDLRRASARGAVLPVQRFDLIEVFGTLAHFAGTGWDAEIIDDFHAQKTGLGFLPSEMRRGLAGYLQGLFLRTVPRHVLANNLRREKAIEVELVNTGDDALGVDERGQPFPLPGGEHGAVLYRGPANVCAAGTSPDWGFGFRAFPFAGAVPRRFCMRIYGGSAIEALMHMRQLWRGDHPVPKMHTWLLTRCHARFSRPVPFQAGGDRLGHKTEVEYAISNRQVDLLDWRRLARA
jgi:diacylglycerol kinase family enzyme